MTEKKCTCGIKGEPRCSAKECVGRGQIRNWGLKALSEKLLESYQQGRDPKTKLLRVATKTEKKKTINLGKAKELIDKNTNKIRELGEKMTTATDKQRERVIEKKMGEIRKQNKNIEDAVAKNCEQTIEDKKEKRNRMELLKGKLKKEKDKTRKKNLVEKIAKLKIAIKKTDGDLTFILGILRPMVTNLKTKISGLSRRAEDAGHAGEKVIEKSNAFEEEKRMINGLIRRVKEAMGG